MRVALISIDGQPREASRDQPFRIAGKTLVHRQLDFALAAGCERIVALGDGTAGEAIALRHVAENAGARFEVVRSGHGLLGAVKAADELLALAPGLLPESIEALELLAKGSRVLVLPASSGIAAGFERIDAERAWAGAVVVSGANVERLSGLADDVEPASALVRIALQARIAERRLPEESLADGSWSIVAERAETGAVERAWLKRNLPPAPGRSVSSVIASQVLRTFGVPLLGARQALIGLPGVVVALLAGAVGAAAYGLAPLGFGLIAVGSLLAGITAGLAALRDAPFKRMRTKSAVSSLLPVLADAALVAVGAQAIGGDWWHRLFPPLVLLAALHASRWAGHADWRSWLGDRALLAAIFAIAAAPGWSEPAIMVAALALLALSPANSAANRG